MDKLIEKITSISEERFRDEDLNDCFIVDIIVNGSKIEVFIDSDPGVTFKQCQRLSRSIEAYLDESTIIGSKYILEVSSPGIDRPLKFKRQYPRNVGRKIELTKIDGTVITGKMTTVESNFITIEIAGKKKKEVTKVDVPFDEIEKTKILVTFSK